MFLHTVTAQETMERKREEEKENWEYILGRNCNQLKARAHTHGSWSN